MYGPDLLIAPVTEPGMTQWDVYLPGPEDWIWLWDDQETVISGQNSVTVDAVMGETPVFYKANSPWKTTFQNINQDYSLSQN